MGRPLVDKDTPYAAIGRQVRAARLARGLSQVEVAQRLGYAGQGSYQRIESGANRPTVEILRKLADILGLNPTDLVLAAAPAEAETVSAVPEKPDRHGAPAYFCVMDDEMEDAGYPRGSIWRVARVEDPHHAEGLLIVDVAEERFPLLRMVTRLPEGRLELRSAERDMRARVVAEQDVDVVGELGECLVAGRRKGRSATWRSAEQVHERGGALAEATRLYESNKELERQILRGQQLRPSPATSKAKKRHSR